MITCRDLNFSYGKEPLFRQLNLSVPGGTIYGLLGMNGAGKTTLLKLLSGQLFPESGQIDVLGFDPARRHPDMLADIFYLPEEFYLPRCTVSQYLSIYAPFYPKFDTAAFSRYLEHFGIDRRKLISSYSFGQKKKFLLAFGLASNTAILILDEPTNGLDIPSKSQFRRTVASAITDDRIFIISTHQVRDMDHLIDPIIILHDGRIIFNRALAEIEENFTVALERSEPSDGQAIYSEKVPGGYSVVRRNTGSPEERPLDLEVLFGAVIAHPEAFSARSREEQA